METKPKSLVLSLLCGWAFAVLSDIKYLYTRPSDWERDHSRLSHELGCHGERLLTIDFPAVGKHFDKCLDQGQYWPCNLPLTRLASGSVQVPAFLRGLYLLVFDTDGKLRVTPDVNAILAIRSLLMGAKKLRLNYQKRSLHDELDKFIKCEKQSRTPSLNWLGDDLFSAHPGLYSGQVSSRSLRSAPSGTVSNLVERLHSADALPDPSTRGYLLCEIEHDPMAQFGSRDFMSLLLTIQQVADVVSSQFGDLHIEEDGELPKHGPGVVSDLTAKESKFDFPYWTEKTQRIFPFDYYGSHVLAEHGFSKQDRLSWVSFEAPSKIIAVPKTAKGPRLIACEPHHHQWLQQLVMNQLVRRLERTSIAGSVRFNDQSRNREFALKGSVDGSYATIDLSSASDRLSCWTVERLMRSNLTLLERLHACRTRSAEWKGTKDYPKFRMVLKKFAPMGSAVTFPVQSIIYCTIAIGVRLWLTQKHVSSRTIKAASTRISVFGDDIIVPRGDCVTLIKALEYFGLEVNHSKTFGAGKFRESCGIDAYGGYDVTPPYVLDLPDQVRFSQCNSLIAVVNNYYEKGFWITSEFLKSRLGKYNQLIPVTTRRDLGNCYFSYSGVDVRHLKRRYNVRLQREEVLALKSSTDKGKGHSSPASRLFQWFIEKPQPDTNWSSGVVSRKNSKTSSGWIPVETLSKLS